VRVWFAAGYWGVNISEIRDEHNFGRSNRSSIFQSHFHHLLLDLHWVRALTVPMHLGLTYGPFVPHNPISAQESPAPLPKFQMAPRLKILMSSGSKKRTQIYCTFLSKSPNKRIPSRFPNGAPMERDTRLQGILRLS
jgi:hypothetical protein